MQFTADVIEKIHAKFMADLRNRDIFNLEHDTEKKVPAYILETWIVDNPTKDKAFSTFGIEVPEGTLMVTAQVTDPEYYNKLVEEGQVGFSIEGFLGLKLSEQLNLNTMKLPDGEHTIEDEIYVIKDGEVVEIKEVEKEPTEEVVEEEMSTEEVAMEETTVEETTEEDTTTTDTEMAIDPATDAEAILAIVLQPMPMSLRGSKAFPLGITSQPGCPAGLAGRLRMCASSTGTRAASTPRTTILWALAKVWSPATCTV